MGLNMKNPNLVDFYIENLTGWGLGYFHIKDNNTLCESITPLH
jgi:hypothetical protein